MQNPDVRSWHKPDVRLAAPEGPLTGALPTFGAQCPLFGQAQTSAFRDVNAPPNSFTRITRPNRIGRRRKAYSRF